RNILRSILLSLLAILSGMTLMINLNFTKNLG
ncbi:MAG: hypothetical protein ACI8RO_001466, partial [Flavobacteriales bacterium]